MSQPFALGDGFRRLGLLWDAAAENLFEVRTSVDGTTWSSWALTAVVSVEMVAHAGHLDAFDLGGAGSTEADPVAKYFQVRLTQTAAPTFLIVEPWQDIPAAFDPDRQDRAQGQGRLRRGLMGSQRVLGGALDSGKVEGCPPATPRTARPAGRSR